MIKIEKQNRPQIWDDADVPPRYRLIIDGVIVREDLSFDEAIEAVCRRDEERENALYK